MKPTTLGEFIRVKREATGKSLRAFAQALEISAPHQSDIEHNRRRPSPELMVRMARALDVPLEDLERLDARVTPDMKEWLERHPEVAGLLREVRESGRARELVVAWHDIKSRQGS